MPSVASEEPPPDPSLDRGWAWVVSVGACLINIISLGSIRCLGILVNNASVEFSVNKRDSSLIFSITYVTLMMSSTLFIALTRVVSCRVLIFVGGILTSCGLCLAYFLPTPPALASGTAVLLGLGISASQSPAILLLNQYFDRYRSRANGIAFAGGPIGSFLMPPLLTHLMHKFTFRGAMLLWGGIALHVCAAACLMRPKPPPPPPPPPPPSPPSQPQAQLATSGPAYGKSLEDLLPFAEDGEETTMVDADENDLQDDGVPEEEDDAASQQQQQERPLTPVALVDPPPPPPVSKTRSVLAAMCGLDLRLFRNPLLYVLGLVITMGLCGLPLSFYIIPLHGREIGLSSTTTSLFLLLQGIPDLLSRLLVGFITDKRLMTHLRLAWLALISHSVFWFLLLAMPSYGGLLFFSIACGLVGGVMTADTHPLAINQLGLANYRAAFATYSIVHGCWMLCMPILLGQIYDKTDTWRLAIAFVACVLALAGVTALLLDLFQTLRAMTHRVVGRLWRP